MQAVCNSVSFVRAASVYSKWKKYAKVWNTEIVSHGRSRDTLHLSVCTIFHIFAHPIVVVRMFFLLYILLAGESNLYLSVFSATCDAYADYWQEWAATVKYFDSYNGRKRHQDSALKMLTLSLMYADMKNKTFSIVDVTSACWSACSTSVYRGL